MWTRQEGLTLLELLVILLILAAVVGAVALLFSDVLSSAEDSAQQAELDQIQRAMWIHMTVSGKETVATAECVSDFGASTPALWPDYLDKQETGGGRRYSWDEGGNVVVCAETVTPTQDAVHVGNIDMSVEKPIFFLARARADVTIVDQDDQPGAGATVHGAWSGVVSGTCTANTNAGGIATLRSSWTLIPGIFTFTVQNVVASGYGYDSAANVETCDSISWAWFKKVPAEPIPQPVSLTAVPVDAQPSK